MSPRHLALEAEALVFASASRRAKRRAIGSENLTKPDILAAVAAGKVRQPSGLKSLKTSGFRAVESSAHRLESMARDDAPQQQRSGEGGSAGPQGS